MRPSSFQAAEGLPPATLRPLRLLLIVASYYPDTFGGAERQATILARALAGLGVSTRILAPSVQADAPESEATDFGSIERVRVRHFPNYGGRRIGSTAAWVRAALRRFAGGAAADLIYVFHARLHVLAGLALKRRTGAPLMVKLGGGGEASDFAALRAKRFLYGRWVEREVVRRTDLFVANSRQIEEDLREAGTPPERVLSLSNGVELPPRARLAEANGRRRGGRFVFTGRMEPDKNPAVLFEAAATLLAEGRALDLTFLGEGPERARLQAEAERRGLTNRITLPGRVDDVYAELFAHDVFVSASEREGQSNALIEAMSAGCVPLVAGGASGATELVEPGHTGLLADRSTAPAFAGAMRAALDLSDARRRELGAAARARVEADAGVEAVATRTRAAFDTLLAARP